MKSLFRTAVVLCRYIMRAEKAAGRTIHQSAASRHWAAGDRLGIFLRDLHIESPLYIL